MTGYYAIDISERIKRNQGTERQPFFHQRDAYIALSKTLNTPISGYKGTLLVFPTAGGKTFASVNWICRNILTKGIKVLWLAQSSYLIDQAAQTFIEEIPNAAGRNQINLRVVSSSTSHANAGSIAITDDVLICTTQSAISAYNSRQLDEHGSETATPFRKFIDHCAETSLFVVVDEAHHTPAYGCRTLLLAMREQLKNLYILGLTATPMHMDKRISGWLKRIYDRWICYEADKNLLQANKILAIPKYIEKKTGMEVEVNDNLFDRLVRQHKDLPENIVEYLADNQNRNNFIISDYLNNRMEYGKTLIFVDRWFQCEYLVEKLQQQGVKAAAVYSVVTAPDAVYRGGSGRRNDEMNRQIMQDFRNGLYEVVVNVRMLTEGVDVPDVKTVMITRQTTSNILLTQMIGRALRGEKAGGGPGKDYANIVFFHDTWKRLLPWANVDGETDAERPVHQGRNPMELISVQLIRLAAADIEFQGFEDAPFLTFIPVGFYGCEYTVSVAEGGQEEMISFEENTIVYEFNKEKYERFLDALAAEDLARYAAEDVAPDALRQKSEEIADRFFDRDMDNFDDLLEGNIEKIVRHMAQNGTKPVFIDFHQRDLYDLDKFAAELINIPPLSADGILLSKFNDESLHWNFLYKTYNSFLDAYYKAQKRALTARRGQSTAPVPHLCEESQDILTEEIKHQVFARDNFTCQCCGKPQRRGVVLNADHIRPVAMGGPNAVSNLQTLCRQCNNTKGVNEVNYRTTVSPLRQPKPALNLIMPAGSDEAENAIARIVNDFYHCKAMCKLNWHERRSGQYYSTWEIVLYDGNNPEWLAPHVPELLGFIWKRLGRGYVKHLIIKK